MVLRSAIKKIVSFFIFSNIFLALAVTSLVFETWLILYDRVPDLHYPFFLFSSTLFLYCFHRVYRMDKGGNGQPPAERHRWVLANLSLFYTVTLLAAAGVLVSLIFFVDGRTVLYLLPVAILSFGYTVPCIPTSRGLLRLRDLGLAKIFFISLVLGVTTVLLPVLARAEFSVIHDPAIIFIFLRRMLFIYAITIPFDIRDINYDAQQGTRTIPVRWGTRFAKGTAQLALGLFTLLAILQFICVDDTDPWYIIALIVSALSASLVVMRTDEKKSDLFYSFVAEGMMLLQCILVMAAHIALR